MRVAGLSINSVGSANNDGVLGRATGGTAREAIGTVADGSWRCAGPPGRMSMRRWSGKAGRSPTGGT